MNAQMIDVIIHSQSTCIIELDIIVEAIFSSKDQTRSDVFFNRCVETGGFRLDK